MVWSKTALCLVLRLALLPCCVAAFVLVSYPSRVVGPKSFVKTFNQQSGSAHEIRQDLKRWMLKEGFEESRNESRNRQRRFANSRRGVKIPLLVLIDEADPTNISPVIFPMPMSHVPVTEMSTLNLYGTELTSPVHIRMAQEALQSEEKLYGQIIYKPNSDNLVGSIGVACRILRSGPPAAEIFGVSEIGADMAIMEPEDTVPLDPDNPEPTTIFVRGSFRFVVKEVIKSFPYPVAVVDELLDDEVMDMIHAQTEESVEEENEDDEDDDDDDDDEDIYESIPAPELMARTLSAMKAHVQMKVEDKDGESLLQQQLNMQFDNQDLITESEKERISAQETAAVFELFFTELVEMNDVLLRRYAVGLMAVELLDLDFHQRQQALITTNGTERLRSMLRILEPKVSMQRAQKVASEISGGVGNPTSATQRDLQVGRPGLPPWASQVQKGLKVEYYWNEEFGWCRGTVQKTERVVDEILVTLAFDDGQTVVVPLNGEEKARWRPAAN